MAHTDPTPLAVREAALALGRLVSTEQAEPLAAYLAQLSKWNRKMNLVGPSRWRDVFDTLVVDSLYLADFMTKLPLPTQPLCLDLGAGAGLPGIPLRCVWQAGEYRLVEVREKRAMFMRSVLGRMGLPGTGVFHGRAEDALDGLADEGFAKGADLIVSRAFMPWKKLLDFTRPMLRDNGIIVILANDGPPETADLPSGWRLHETSDYPAAGSTRFFWALGAV